MQTNDSLAKAIAYLGAVEVAPGRYAYKSMEQWYVATLENGCDLYALKSGQGRDLAALPSWWTPESRFAWRIIGDESGTRYAKGVDVWADARHGFDGDEAAFDVYAAENAIIERITADLETGAEVPA